MGSTSIKKGYVVIGVPYLLLHRGEKLLVFLASFPASSTKEREIFRPNLCLITKHTKTRAGARVMSRALFASFFCNTEAKLNLFSSNMAALRKDPALVYNRCLRRTVGTQYTPNACIFELALDGIFLATGTRKFAAEKNALGVPERESHFRFKASRTACPATCR